MAKSSIHTALCRLINVRYIAIIIIVAGDIPFLSVVQQAESSTVADTTEGATTITYVTTSPHTTEGTTEAATTIPRSPPGEPTDVSLVASNETALLMTWSNVTQALYYQILCISECDVSDNTTEISYEIIGLTPGTLYEVGVAACNDVGCSSDVTQSTNTFPSAPGPLTMLSSTTDTLTASWNQTGNFSEFVVFVNDSAAICNYSTKNGTIVTAVISGSPLNTGGSVYCLNVSTMSFALISQSSTNSCDFATVPDTPLSLTSLGSTTDSVEVAWIQSGNAGSYSVTVNDNETWPYVNFTFGEANASNSTVVYNLPISGVAYNLSITAYSNNLISQPSSSSEFVTNPLPPGSVLCGPATNTSVQVEVNPPSGSSSSYNIADYWVVVKSVTEGNYVGGNLTVPFSDSVTSIAYNNATAGVTYLMTVYSTVPGATSLTAQQINCTAVLNAPTSPSLGTVGETSATVSWLSPPGYYDGFIVNCSSSAVYSNGALSQSYKVFTNSNGQTVDKYTCSSLTAGAYYSITIETFINSSATPPVSSTALSATTEPQSPADVTCSSLSESSIAIQISWPYSVSQSQCSYFNISTNTAATTYQVPCPNGNGDVTTTLTRLVSDTLIKVEVTSVANKTTPIGVSASPTAGSAWTLAEQVTGLSLSSVTQTSFVINWSPPGPASSVTGYGVAIDGVATSSATDTVLNCSSNINCSSSSISYTVIGLSPAVNYTVYVWAINPGGIGPSSFVSTITSSDVASCGGGCIAGIVIGCIAAIVLIIIIVKVVTERRARSSPSRYRRSSTMNPAFVVDDDSSSDVRVEDFRLYVGELAKDSNLRFSAEYELLSKKCEDLRLERIAAELPENRVKNRFTNVLPFDDTRVKLISHQSDYINASYVPGFNGRREYIASQGPMRSTVDDHWRMIWEQNISVIVMLTNLDERGREKCEQYWPEYTAPAYFSDVMVTLLKETNRGMYVVREMRVTLVSTGQNHLVTQYHFIAWPDFGVPSDMNGFLDFIATFRCEFPSSPGPYLVHCSAGVGRTGVFILVDRLLEHIRRNNTLNVFATIYEMRQCRPLLVQTEAQYVFVHQCIVAAIERGWSSRDNRLPINYNAADDSVYMNLSDGRFGSTESPYANYSGETFK